MVVNIYNPSIQGETETGRSKFKASLDYMLRPCFKIMAILIIIINNIINKMSIQENIIPLQ